MMEAAVANAAAAERVLQLSLLEDVLWQRQCAYEKCGKWFTPKSKFHPNQQYCSTRCIKRASAQRCRKDEHHLPEEVVCAHGPCVEKFKPRHRSHKYCDKHKHPRDRRLPLAEKRCLYWQCEQWFTPKRRCKGYCSTTCWRADTDEKKIRAKREENFRKLKEAVVGLPLLGGHLTLEDGSHIFWIRGQPKSTHDRLNTWWSEKVRGVVGRSDFLDLGVFVKIQSCFMLREDRGRGRGTQMRNKVKARPELLHPCNNTPDWDNLAKLVQDETKYVAFSDDRVVSDGGAKKRWATECWGAGVVFRISADQTEDPTGPPPGLNWYELLAKAGFWTGDRDDFPGDHEWLPDKDVI